MRKVYFFLLLLVFCLPYSVRAQDETLDVSFTRDWGYGGFSGEIQGKFSFRVTGPENLVEVRIMIDDGIMAVIAEPPFTYQFDTEAYSPGLHTLKVIGILADGTQLEGPEYKRLFLSAEEARGSTMKLIVPLLIGVGGISLLAAILPILFSKKKEIRVGQYGLAGGAVCTRCQLPFSRSMLAPNLLLGKLERCPHCGKWGIVRAATPQELAAAEKRFSTTGPEVEQTPHAKLEQWKKSLDETRYE